MPIQCLDGPVRQLGGSVRARARGSYGWSARRWTVARRWVGEGGPGRRRRAGFGPAGPASACGRHRRGAGGAVRALLGCCAARAACVPARIPARGRRAHPGRWAQRPRSPSAAGPSARASQCLLSTSAWRPAASESEGNNAPNRLGLRIRAHVPLKGHFAPDPDGDPDLARYSGGSLRGHADC